MFEVFVVKQGEKIETGVVVKSEDEAVRLFAEYNSFDGCKYIYQEVEE